MGYHDSISNISKLQTLLANLNNSADDLSSLEDFQTMEDHVNAVIKLTYYAMVILFGLPGNAIIIRAYARKKRRTSTDVLIMAQAIVDFVACSLSPVFIIRAAFQEFSTKGLCQVASLAENTAAFASLFLTNAISVDRYMAVCRPLRRRMMVRTAIFIAVLCAVISVAINIPVAVYTKLHNIVIVERKVCFLRNFYVLGSTMTSLVLFMVSLMINTFLYVLIYASLRKRAKIHANLMSNDLPVATITSNKDNGNELESCSRFQHRNRESSKTGKETSDWNSHHADVTSIKNMFEFNNHTLHLESAGCSISINEPSLPGHKVSGSHLLHSKTETPQDHSTMMKSYFPHASSPKTKSVESHGLNRVRKSRSKHENDYGRKTTRMLLIMTMFFFVTWSPEIIIHLIPTSILLKWGSAPGYAALLRILLDLRLTNHIVNFFLYYLVSNTFRRDVKESLGKCKCNK